MCGQAAGDLGVCVCVGGLVGRRGDDVEGGVKLGKQLKGSDHVGLALELPMAEDAAGSRWLGLRQAVVYAEVR
jgi:hypothetical protein